MAEPKTSELMEKIVALCKRRGFIYQSSEIYGGINGFWDYGPLGAELKNNVKELWWREMTRLRDDVAGLDATIIMSPKIWEASGHVSTFSDPMCDCRCCKKRFRADQVPEQILETKWGNELLGIYERCTRQFPARSNELYWAIDKELKVWVSQKAKRNVPNLEAAQFAYEVPSWLVGGYSWPSSFEHFLKHLASTTTPDWKEWGLPCPNCGGRLTAPRPFNLMFKTLVGPMDMPSLNMALLRDDFQKLESLRLEQAEIQKADPSRAPELTQHLTELFKITLESLRKKLDCWNEAFEESQKNVAYLRPETAQAIFAQFKNVLETSRQKVPFGIAQVGKAFRNEVTPRNYTFRSREFEQMELEFFIKPDEAIEAIAGRVSKSSELDPRPSTLDTSTWGWEAWHKYWVEERIRFYERIGLPRATLVEYWQKPAELAHYAKACVDILYKFPFSKRDAQGELMGEELEGIAARSDFDLSQHQRFSGKPMLVFDDELKAAWPKLDPAKQTELQERYYQARLKYLTKSGEAPDKTEKQARADAEALTKGYYVPHVIEPSAGVDRLALALICNAYAEDQAPDEKGKMESRVVMRFHPRVAPIKVAVFPLLKNRPELVKKAKEVRDLLRPHLNVFYDDAGAIGRRYRRQDEAGTPFGVTIDFETLGEKGPELQDTVTVRDRDTMKQERVKISALLPLLLEKLR